MVNLIQDKWIPVIRRDGSQISIAPWQVTDNYEENPIQWLNAPRADFNGALIQFLIGLVQTALPPSSDREWFRRFESPPQPPELRERFTTLSHAFEMDVGEPRFMQDFDLPEKTKTFEINQLLIEMPGEKTVEDNSDHFIKRGTVQQICPYCCAMALYTLQTNAPGGGQGHRTSLRGGGPLTTIVVGRTLWETVWLNVMSSGEFVRHGNADLQEDADIFPWLRPTRTSEGKEPEPTTPQDAHPAQMFWGMPRRIRIEQDEVAEGICDLCGCSSVNLVQNYQTKNHGVYYSEDWRHTLTPYGKDKSGKHFPILGRRVKTISYRYWLGLVQNELNSRWEPASVIHAFREKRLPDLPEVPFRLWAFGYDMDKMKARCWYEGTMPLIKVDESIRANYEVATAQLITAASLVAETTRKAIIKALFSEKADVKGDVSVIEDRFWKDTENQFYKALDDLKKALEVGEETTELKRKWLHDIQKEAENLFDEYSQSALIGVANPQRIATARRELRNLTSSTAKRIRETLDLPKPPSRKKSTKIPA